MRILIAEDDFTSRIELTAVLKKQGHVVEATMNGAEAWQAMQQPDAPRLAILDWIMPEMNGLDVVRRVRALQTDRPPYIIMLTIHSEKENIVKCLEAGADDYIAKPYDPGELHARVNVGRRILELQAAFADKVHALRESEERYQLAMDATVDGLWDWNIKADEWYFSPGYYRLLGYEVGAFPGTGNAWKELIHPDDRKNALRANMDCIEGRCEHFKVEFRMKAKNGEWRWILGRGKCVARDEQGCAMRLVGTHMDITERKRAEAERTILQERLQHADKMESIGTLAGGIAHDFNNLLMVIQGYLSLTLLDLDPSHPHYERLKRIEEQVQSGADLTKQLMGFARGGRYEVKPADLNDILKKSSSMFGRTKKEISIHRKYGKDLRTVEVDRGQMEQVFMNLYVNAWQAMPGGGEIYLETEDVLLDDEQAILYVVAPGKYVKITVTDTGTGMDEKTRERIFDPFFTTKEMGRGTGLGLATVYGIIKGHKGTIHVDSEPGHGTTFHIYLPASEKEMVKEKTATGTIIARGTETILLVDDEKMILEVSKELLESMGYRVYAAGSGQEAIAVYMEKQKEIALVLLDMIMPGISGGETFDRLREINPGIKVLLSSGYSIKGQAQEIMDRGCNGFLQKPFRLENLSRKVREMLV